MLNTSLPLPCGVTLHNRLAKAALTERFSRADYLSNELHQKLYEIWPQQVSSFFCGFYARQLIRLAKGKAPQLDLNPLAAALFVPLHEMRKAVGKLFWMV